MFFRLCAAVLFGVLASLPVARAQAAQITMDTAAGQTRIRISGEIVEADLLKFRRLALEAENALVVLSSPGGYLDPALEIGEIIRLKGYDTLVPAGQTCTSSCALIWVAGTTRYLAPDAQVGFHAAYIDDNGKLTEIGIGNALVGRYLTLLNLPRKAVEFATLASPDEIHWIDVANPGEAGIAFSILGDTSGLAAAPAPAAPRQGGIRAPFEWTGAPWVVVNSDAEQACILAASFEDERGRASELMFNVVRAEDSVTLIMANHALGRIRDGEERELRLVFVTGDAVDADWGTQVFAGVRFDETSGGIAASFERGALMADLREEEYIGFFDKEDVIDSFPLAGIAPALAKLSECLNEG